MGFREHFKISRVKFGASRTRASAGFRSQLFNYTYNYFYCISTKTCKKVIYNLKDNFVINQSINQR